MAKDILDKDTKDMITRGAGRPAIYPERGPLTQAERKERSRRGRKATEILLFENDVKKIKRYCKRYGISRHDLVSKMIQSLRLTKPSFL